MHVMSLPAPQKPGAKRTGKRITFFAEQAMKEASQHQQDFYLQTGNVVDPGQSEAASTVTSSNADGRHNMYLNSVIFSPDKGDQSRGGHYQQTVPMKWSQQEVIQQQQQQQQQQRQAAWTSSMANWASNYPNFMGDARNQTGFVKPVHEQQQPTNSLISLTATQANPQSFQDTLKPLNPQQQQHANAGGSSSVLQPFQLAFGQPKATQLPSYYQAFQGGNSNNRTASAALTNPPSYQSKPHNVLQQQQQQQHNAMHMLQSQTAQQQQQLEQRVSAQQLQHQRLNQQNLHDFFPSAQHHQQQQQPVVVHSNETILQAHPKIQQPLIQDITPEPLQQTSDPLRHVQQQEEPVSPQLSLRRSRRLSKEGGGEPSTDNPFLVSQLQSSSTSTSSFPEQSAQIQNGAPTGVIQSTRRKRRVSQEVNLETLAQKASEMESLPSNFVKNGDSQDDDPKKSRRRPRPEPLFIPPPKPSLFIAPPVYSSITPYQSHLRSPVRLMDNPLAMPPYTPPPILSPVREGSGLYFSTFLSAASASVQGIPPPTPKSATRSLLRSNSSDITPPVLTSIGEATPVSLEPRINIGSRYQAEIPELRSRTAVEQDQHKAALLWAPLKELEDNHSYQQKVQDLMHLACSSVFSGGGTNQELAHHCLFQCRGDVLAALSLMMLRNPLFPKSHHLSKYHYSGSDNWSAAERRQFNKGIAAHKKDFFMVQKQREEKRRKKRGREKRRRERERVKKEKREESAWRERERERREEREERRRRREKEEREKIERSEEREEK
ncbi:hypothetical protein WMY93_016841 [Mugilogobius chulae]|uniref:ELM2 domain-containing protein n=1 Tax=Mugilogobius chulae TaxID=88201 RepID=A0AAW0NYQ1_9GOBI